MFQAQPSIQSIIDLIAERIITIDVVPVGERFGQNKSWLGSCFFLVSQMPSEKELNNENSNALSTPRSETRPAGWS